MNKLIRLILRQTALTTHKEILNMTNDEHPSIGSMISDKISLEFKEANYAAVIAAAPQILQMGAYNNLVPTVIKSALRINSPEAIESAVGLAIQCDSSAQERARHALLLAQGAKMTEALLVLFSDPKIQWFPEHAKFLAPVLGMIKRSMNKQSPAAITAGRIGRYIENNSHDEPRSKNLALAERSRSNYGFTTDIKRLVPKFLGAPTILTKSDPSLSVQHEELIRGLEQAEAKILAYRVPEVFEFKDVFINRYGDVWKTDGAFVKHSSKAPAILPSASISIHSEDTLIAACSVEATKNPYLWLTRFLPSLAWRWELTGVDLPIGISDTARPWVEESINLASKESTKIIKVGDAVFAKRLLLISPHMHFLARHEAYKQCFERLITRAVGEGEDTNTSPVYISRRDSGRRVMRNELALEEALSQRGVKSVVLTGLSLADKIKLFRKAPLIVGAHGAGFGILPFAEPGRKVIEILPVHTPFTHHRVNIPNLSRIMGHEHHHYLSLPTKAYDDDSWELNLDGFLNYFDENFP
jgi:capsular polysaccharide biosynthesis protein